MATSSYDSSDQNQLTKPILATPQLKICSEKEVAKSKRPACCKTHRVLENTTYRTFDLLSSCYICLCIEDYGRINGPIF